MRTGPRSGRRGSALALVTAASLLVTAPASAANPGAGRATATNPDQARADAEKRLDEGLRRYAKGDFDGARLAFAQAYAVLTSIDLLYNLMRSEVKSGHPLEALVHIHQMLRDPKATTEDRAKAERLLEEANHVTGHVAVEAPAGAEILLDHVESGEAPLNEAFDVTSGKHMVEARWNGSSRAVQVDAPAGQIVTARFAVDVSRTPTVSAPVPATVAATSPSPPSPAPAPPPTPAKPQVVERTEPPPVVEPEPPRHHERESNARIVVPLVIGAVGVVGLGVGIGMGVASQGQQTSAASFRTSNPPGFCADQASATCTQYQGILNSQQSDTNVSRVMLVGGGVLAVAAVVTYLAWPTRHGMERGAWVAPTIGGAVVGGAF